MQAHGDHWTALYGTDSDIESVIRLDLERSKLIDSFGCADIANETERGETAFFLPWGSVSDGRRFAGGHRYWQSHQSAFGAAGRHEFLSTAIDLLFFRVPSLLCSLLHFKHAGNVKCGTLRKGQLHLMDPAKSTSPRDLVLLR
jgi:hypothetical protein